jgi:hypothetical protein
MKKIDKIKYPAPWCDIYCIKCKNYYNDDCCEGCGVTFKQGSNPVEYYPPTYFEGVGTQVFMDKLHVAVAQISSLEYCSTCKKFTDEWACKHCRAMVTVEFLSQPDKYEEGDP